MRAGYSGCLYIAVALVHAVEGGFKRLCEDVRVLVFGGYAKELELALLYGIV